MTRTNGPVRLVCSRCSMLTRSVWPDDPVPPKNAGRIHSQHVFALYVYVSVGYTDLVRFKLTFLLKRLTLSGDHPLNRQWIDWCHRPMMLP